LILACVEQRLSETANYLESAACCVAAAGGYPRDYKGQAIKGIETV